MFGKHSKEAYTMKELKEIIKRKDREIKDIKGECADEFARIATLCFCNTYDEKLNVRRKLEKIHEVAMDNALALMGDIVIESNPDQRAKIIELTGRQSR